MIDFFKSGFEFTYKAASAALFGILLLLAFAQTASMGSELFYGFYRYDYLLFFALLIQVVLLYTKLESWAEAKVIALFHIMAMVMEIFLTHPAIASWQYPQPAIFAGLGSLVLHQLYEQILHSGLSLAVICLEYSDVLENQNSVSVESACFSAADVACPVDLGLYYLGG